LIVLPKLGISKCCTRKLVMPFDTSIANKGFILVRRVISFHPPAFQTQFVSFNPLVMETDTQFIHVTAQLARFPHPGPCLFDCRARRSRISTTGLCSHRLIQPSAQVFSAHLFQAGHFPQAPQKLTSSHRHHSPISSTNSWLNLLPQASSDTV
jgi:hypothetical protein